MQLTDFIYQLKINLMLYYQKIKEFIDDDNEEALIAWMKEQPLTEQLIITQALKDVLAEMWSDEDNTEKLIFFAKLDNILEQYNDKNLDVYNAKVAYEKAAEQRDMAFAEMQEKIEGVRAYLIECVTTNAPNAKEMKELALKIIESEQEHGLYDADNWKGIV